MKSKFIEIVGQTITGVVIKEELLREPRTQLFLLFQNERYFEFYFPESLIYHTRGPGLSLRGTGTIVLGVEAGGVTRTGLDDGPHSSSPRYICAALVFLRSFRISGERSFDPGVLHTLLGKKISAVLNHESQHDAHRLWILFDDAKYLEIEDQHYPIIGCGGIDKGGIDTVRQYMADRRIIYEDLADSGPSSSTVQ